MRQLTLSNNHTSYRLDVGCLLTKKYVKNDGSNDPLKCIVTQQKSPLLKKYLKIVQFLNITGGR